MAIALVIIIGILVTNVVLGLAVCLTMGIILLCTADPEIEFMDEEISSEETENEQVA